MKRKILSMILAACLVLSLFSVTALAAGTEGGDYVTLELTYGSNVSGADQAAAEALYNGMQYPTCKAANEAYMALFGVNWKDREGGKPYLTVTDYDAPLYKYAGIAGSVTEVKYYIHGTLAGFTSLLSDGNQIDCTVGGNHQIFRTSYSIIGVDDEAGNKAQLTDGNVQAYVAGGYSSSFNPSGKLTIDNIDFTTTTSTTVGASAACDPNAGQDVTSAEMEIKNCTFHGRLYVYDNFDNEGKMTYSIHDNVFDGTAYSGDSNAYPIFAQCRGGNELLIQDNHISGYARGINIDNANVRAVITGNTISVTDAGRACIQLSSLTSAEIKENELALTGGNAITLHEKLLTMTQKPEVTIADNEITGYGYFLYDDAVANKKAFTANDLTLNYSNNTFTPDAGKTISTTQGVKGGKVYGVSDDVSLTVNGPLVYIGEQGYASLRDALEALRTSTEEAVTIELLHDQNADGFTVDLSRSALQSLTIAGNGKVLDSGVHGVEIDGPVRCPVICAKLPAGGTFTVDSIVAPGSLLFDTSSDASLVVKNSTFYESQTGYPAAKDITYQGNTFAFRGDASEYYTNNAYPVWYKTETSTRSISFLNNTVTGPRGFHVETRSADEDKTVDITVTGNHFTLKDDDYPNKAIALQLVRNLNGEITFTDNYVDAYMGVCFFKDIAPQNDPKLTIANNHTTGKLYGSSEWTHRGSTEDEKIAAADEFAKTIVEGRKDSDNGSTITEGHTHNYVNGVCSICGNVQSGTSHGTSSGGRKPSAEEEPADDRLFKDVPTDAYYADAVAWAAESGITNGTGNGFFGAALPCTRAQIVTFLWRAAGSPVVADTMNFTDLAPNAYYTEAVRWAVSKGITAGTSAATFSPDSVCTRAQAVTFLYRALGVKAAASTQFSDVAADSFFAEAVAWAAENDVTAGVGGSRFAPHDVCTRAQIVTFLYRAYQER